ncbi:MAG TPA: hypothetical protein VK699_05985 [Terriglobales bacterium]|nr:hypothetical protein [Terriglobales bacterium]
MHSTELSTFRLSKYLHEVDDQVLQWARPIFDLLINTLIAMPESSSENEKLRCFEVCVNALNEFELDIDTIRREDFCDALYEIGKIVGLDPKTDYVDKWRYW